MSEPEPKHAELITIGEELLLGLTTNTHLAFIGEQLRRRGMNLRRNVVVDDQAETIAGQLRESWARARLIITTGGLGPTSDDRTREAIARELGQELLYDQAIEAAIRQRFAQLGRKMTPNNRRQAWRPAGAEVLANPNGTAPGLWLEQDGRILVMLPGPPHELMPMFVEHVLPRLAARRFLAGEETFIQLRTAGVGESALEHMLQPIFDETPGLAVGFCASEGRVDLRLSSPDGRLSRPQLQIVANRCRERLGHDFICFGHDPLVKVVADLLRLGDFDLAVAEGCTGGLLANSFTEVCGATKVFCGGIICHGNDCKVQLLDVPECMLKQHGAVSAEVAVAMAAGVAERLEANFGLAITGFAGPCGGTQEHPVGTIYLGLHSPSGAWSRKVSYPGSGAAVKRRAVNAALDWLRRELLRAQAGAAQQASAPEPTAVEDPARAEALRILRVRKR